MKTLNHVVLVLVLASFGFASFGCGDDSSSPVAPSSTPMAEAPAYAPAGSPSVRPASLSPDVDSVAPGDARYGPNAYDFFAHMDSGMLHVALVEDAMATMRTASQPHRMRQVEVYHVISEPRHVLQTHGDPLYTGTVQLAGRLELPPIAVESCAPHEWIVVTAAELSDDRYDGWRNAPCPQPGGDVVGSDGTGPGWERSEHGAPSRDFPPEPEPEPEPEATPTPTPEPTPTPTPGTGTPTTPDPMPEPEPMPGVMVYELPFNGTDPAGDIIVFDDDMLTHDPEVFKGIDITSFSMSRPDAAGWITVEIRIADAVNIGMLNAMYYDEESRLGGVISSVSIQIDIDGEIGSDDQWYIKMDHSPHLHASTGNGWRADTFVETVTDQTSDQLTDTFSFRFNYPLLSEHSGGARGGSGHAWGDNQEAWVHFFMSYSIDDVIDGERVEIASGHDYSVEYRIRFP